MMDAAAALDVTRAVPGIPLDDDGPVFREPWEVRCRDALGPDQALQRRQPVPVVGVAGVGSGR